MAAALGVALLIITLRAAAPALFRAWGTSSALPRGLPPAPVPAPAAVPEAALLGIPARSPINERGCLSLTGAVAATDGRQQQQRCLEIQRQTVTGSWQSVPAADKAAWTDLDCPCQLRRPRQGQPTPRGSPEAPGVSGCRSRPAGWMEAHHARVKQLKNKYRGERCVLIANGPSLNQMRWDWQDSERSMPAKVCDHPPESTVPRSSRRFSGDHGHEQNLPGPGAVQSD